jgi:hypothetical protein
MLKEERKALRDNMERIYGIHLREDDELLPIIHFITEAATRSDLSNAEAKKLIDEIRKSTNEVFGNYARDYNRYLQASLELIQVAANESKQILSVARKDIQLLPKIVSEFRASINALKIPTHVTVKKISFDSGTMSFLWKYFMISSVVVILSIATSILWVLNANDQLRQIKNLHKADEYDWLLNYQDYMMKNAPDISQQFIDANPRPNFSRSK